MRQVTSRIGARMPISSAVGSNPTTTVEVPISTSVIRNTILRPTRSVIRANTSAPIGRTMNPAAKVNSANTVCAAVP